MAKAFGKTVRARFAHGPARPSWSFGFEVVVRFLRLDWEETSGWPLAEVRAATDARPYPQDMVRKTTVADDVLGGVSVRSFTPKSASADRVILFFHGGSYIYGSGRTSHGDVIARLALGSGMKAISVEYRLAPEHPFPAQLDDALAAFDALVASGVPASAIVVAGDSAGGNLAVELQLALRDRGSEQARAAVLFSPWCDLEMPGASFVENDPFDFGDRATLVKHAQAFAGGAPLADPRISPIHADLAGLHPMFVVAGEAEIPRDDIVAFAERLKAAGVEVTLHLAKDMPHNAPVFAAYHPSGRLALDEAAKFARIC